MRTVGREDADADVARVTAFFHDISELEADQEVHAEEDAHVARELLSSHDDCPDSFVNQVCQAVSDHSYQRPLTDASLEMCYLVEAGILDRTDANGTALMLLRMGYEARTHMNAAEMVERASGRGRDASDRLETDAVRSFTY